MNSLPVEKQALLESMGDDVEFLQKVIGIFLADCPGMMGKIRSGVALGDPVKVMAASHDLRGSVSFFGANSAVEAARILESMGKEKKLEGLGEALCVLEREISLVLSALEDIANGTAK